MISSFVKTQYIKDLQEGQPIDDYFAVSSKTAPRKYNNKDGMWFSFDISDKTGSIPVKFWGRSNEETVKELFSSFKINDVVSIKGGNLTLDSYSKKLTIHLNEDSCEIKKEENFDYAEFVISTTKNIPEMISKFKEEIESITNENIKQLLKSIFDDDDFMKKYSESPAAKGHHHNYVGGLLEHVLSMISMSKTIAKQYEPDLNLDLMIAGCMLHDVGKVFEYETKTVIDYTVTGSLLGHIPIGTKMVEDKIDKLENFPLDLKNKILHLILSHHGSQEAGSPVIPHFPEAVALHKIDDCDAQTKYAIQVKKQLLETTNEDIARGVWQFGFMYLK